MIRIRFFSLASWMWDGNGNGVYVVKPLFFSFSLFSFVGMLSKYHGWWGNGIWGGGLVGFMFFCHRARRELPS